VQSILATGATLKLRTDFIESELDSLEVSRFDRTYIEADKSIGIDRIRSLISQLNLIPAHGKKRAGIIPEAEKATTEAQNALLKLLEEPPKSTHIFLSAPNPAHLLPTIVSRCKIARIVGAGLVPARSLDDIKNIFNPSHITHHTSPITKSFELSQKYGSTRDSADQLLQNALLYTRSKYLVTNPHITHHTLPITHYSQIARKINLSRKLLASNVNPRQVLENLFFDILSV
jgi:hypothetical protein